MHVDEMFVRAARAENIAFGAVFGGKSEVFFNQPTKISLDVSDGFQSFGDFGRKFVHAADCSVFDACVKRRGKLHLAVTILRKFEIQQITEVVYSRAARQFSPDDGRRAEVFPKYFKKLSRILI